MSGSLILLDEATASSSASITLGASNWDNSYNVYMVQFTNIETSTDSTSLNSRFTVSGSPDTTSNYDRAFLNLRVDTSFGNITSTNQDHINLGTIGTGTQELSNGTQFLFSFNDSSKYSFTTAEMVIINNDNNLMGFQGGATLTVNQATDGVTYFMSSGNIASGEFKLYGIRK